MAWLTPTKGIWMYFKKGEKYDAKLVTAFIVFCSIMIATVSIKNYFQFNRIRKYGSKELIQLTLQSNTVITTNDSLRYIGRTQQYYFFWNRFTNISTVYPSSEVKMILHGMNKQLRD